MNSNTVTSTAGRQLPASLAANPRLDLWVRFPQPSHVEISSGKVELGQGISAALIQVAAEELGIPPAVIRLVSGDTSRCPDEGLTAGSLSVETGVAAMRAACAEVRTRMLRYAATTLGVSPEGLSISMGQITAPGLSPDHATNIWQLADGIDWSSPATGDILPRHPAVGEQPPLLRPDLPEKLLSGGFIHDITINDMVHARVIRCTHPRARLRSVDVSVVKGQPDRVRVFRNGSFLAVIASTEIDAVRAHEALSAAAVWDFDPLPPFSDIEGLFRDKERQTRAVHQQGEEVAADENRNPNTRVQRSFSRPFLAHASIGPACAIARHDDTGLTVWSHTQGPFPLARQLSRITGIPQDRVRVIHVPGAGCYGHNGADDVALDAALIAIHCGQPVRVMWTRRDELTCGPFGSAMHISIDASVGADGRIRTWHHTVNSHSHVTRPGAGDGVDLRAAWDMDPPMSPSTPKDFPPPSGGGDRNAVPIYDLPHQDIRYAFVPHAHLRVSAIRSLGAFANIFAIESMMDEIASACGHDPVTLRLTHLGNPRARAVIEAAVKAFGWSEWQDTGDGSRGKGLGFGRYKNTAAWCAVAVDLEIGATLRVKRAVAAVDAGRIVHRDGLINQIEGGIVQAISWTLKESVPWNSDGVAINSWDDYPILGFDECPDISVILLDQPASPSLGVGECAAGPTAAAIANALSQGLGVRATDLPLTPDNIARHMEP